MICSKKCFKGANWGNFGMKKRYFSQKINIFLENHAKFLNLSAKQRKSLQNHLKIC
jgi:hypothetical protein